MSLNLYEGLNGVVALRLTVNILAFLQLTVNFLAFLRLTVTFLPLRFTGVVIN